jgi:hypothetical protein
MTVYSSVVWQPKLPAELETLKVDFSGPPRHFEFKEASMPTSDVAKLPVKPAVARNTSTTPTSVLKNAVPHP